jgi:multidrug efflux system outer membrane protein
MNKNAFYFFAGGAVLLAGCTMAPKYSRPTAPVPAAWPTGPAYATNSATSNNVAAASLKWQDFFQDEKLRNLISLALTNNRDLRKAVLSVERARAMYAIQRDALYPVLNANGTGSKSQVPGDLASSGRRQVNERYDANLGVASWEIDFFGRIRSMKDRALEEYLATEQARRSAQILLVSSVAQTYMALAACHDNLALAENTLESQQNAYNLVKKRRDLGLIPEIELYRAQTPLDTARRDVAVYQKQTALQENALNLLLGAPVPKDLLPGRLDDVTAPQPVTPGLPSDVLLRRPDVVQAENLLKAAYADIGAARAAFFPRISLTAAAGTASADLNGLFKAGSGAWSYAPQIVMPIFDARTWSAARVAKVQREIAVTQYEKAIQSAFKDVADALAASGTVDAELSAQQSLVTALSETHRLSYSRFEKGIDSYLGVLDAQHSLFAAQQVLTVLRLSKLTDTVNLYAVLGGGWYSEQTPVAMASSVPANR